MVSSDDEDELPQEYQVLIEEVQRTIEEEYDEEDIVYIESDSDTDTDRVDWDNAKNKTKNAARRTADGAKRAADKTAEGSKKAWDATKDGSKKAWKVRVCFILELNLCLIALANHVLTNRLSYIFINYETPSLQG